MADMSPKAFDGMELMLSAVPLKGNPGEQGSPGNGGAPGKSNYQIWLEEGNQGTEADFLEAMKGDPGEDGQSLNNRGQWVAGTYNPNDYVFSTGTATDTSLWFLVGSDPYISMAEPAMDLTHWSEFAVPEGPQGLPGENGDPGTKWYIGNGVPSGITANPEDLYLNIDTGSIYQYDGASWVLDGTLMGQATPAAVQAKIDTANTAALADAGKYSRFTNAAAKTWAFDGNTAYVLGTEFNGRNVGAGNLTLTAQNTFVLNAPAGGSLVVPQGGTFTVKIVGAKEGDVIGVTAAP